MKLFAALLVLLVGCAHQQAKPTSHCVQKCDPEKDPGTCSYSCNGNSKCAGSGVDPLAQCPEDWADDTVKRDPEHGRSSP